MDPARDPVERFPRFPHRIFPAVGILLETSAMAKTEDITRADVFPLESFGIDRFRLDPLQCRWSTVMAFLAPALLVYAAFTAYPVLRTFYNSFHRIKPGGVVVFVGLSNFQELFAGDPTFWRAVRNTMVWATVEPCLDVGIGLLLAVCLHARVPLARVFRVLWFTPVLLSYVVVGIIWAWIYNYDWGIANALLRWIGLDGWAQSWLGHPRTALWSLIFTQLWMWTGFNMVVCLAAISALPEEVLEAAGLDNCGWLKKLYFVVIPMIRPTLLNLLILAFIGKMRIFDLVWIMTEGGPLWSTETVATYVYKRAFRWSTFDLGYPSTIATI